MMRLVCFVHLSLLLLFSATTIEAGFFSTEYQRVESNLATADLSSNLDEACQEIDSNNNDIIEQHELDDDEEDIENNYVSEAEQVLEVNAPGTLQSDMDEFGSDMGTPQHIHDRARQDEMKQLILASRAYMNTIKADPTFKPETITLCQNQHELCTFWAVAGECEANPAYMKIHCAPACMSCDQLDVEKRCPLDPHAVNALYPGDIDKLFSNILENPLYQQYEPHAVSRPTLAKGDTEETADYLVGGPWMIVFENAIDQEEAQRLQDLGAEAGYKRSEDVGEKQADGTYTSQTNSGRTSTNAWCNNECYTDPIAERIQTRIENITGIPEANSEYLQLLRYDQTQFYQTHSDYIPFQRERPTGVRILTFYMYLNDVEEGGGTNFPKLNLTVTPKTGRAVLWPSVLNQNPNVRDIRTDHQALPVKEGIKYGANAWIHQRDYKTPNKIGC